MIIIGDVSFVKIEDIVFEAKKNYCMEDIENEKTSGEELNNNYVFWLQCSDRDILKYFNIFKKLRGKQYAVILPFILWKYNNNPVFDIKGSSEKLFGKRRDDIDRINNILSDEKSKETLENIIKYKTQGCKSLLESIRSVGNEYFDTEIVQLDNNEVFLDCGAFDGETSQAFINVTHNTFSGIHMFEPTRQMYYICRKRFHSDVRIRIHNKALWHESTDISFTIIDNMSMGNVLDETGRSSIIVKSVSIDEMLQGEKATFIKMDIEGAEMSALKGSTDTIKTYKPKLVVCLYHKVMGIFISKEAITP